MASTGYDSMDGRDNAIAMEFSKKTDYQDDIDILVPHLAGTDRLLCGNSYDGHNFIAEIEKEKPYKYEDYKVIAGDYITESEKEREDE